MVGTEARQKAKRIVEERGLGGLANDTKWREFFTHVAEQKLPLEVKVIYEEKSFENLRVWSPAENYLEGSGMGPELFVFVEWVRSQAVDKIQAIALCVGLECDVRDGAATVYGYR
jgi:hypothetical protein